MNILGILWPTFALVALIFVVWFALALVRFRHLRRNPPAASDFADSDAALRYFRPVEMPANNLANLFEMPVLYFALVPLLILTTQASSVQVTLAWLFVALRAAHSFIHIVPKNLKARLLVYLLSGAVLLAMWIGFAIDIAAAARAYYSAMANMGAAMGAGR